MRYVVLCLVFLIAPLAGCADKGADKAARAEAWADEVGRETLKGPECQFNKYGIGGCTD